MPLLPGEKEADYASFAARVVGTTKPEDAIEELLIRDVVDLTWEVFRLRRARAGVLVASMSDGVRQVLDSLGHGEGRGYTKELGKAWAAGDKRARREVAAALKKVDEVTAATVESKLDSFERLDRMLASAEARRSNALREIERHRAALGGPRAGPSRRSRMQNSEASRPVALCRSAVLTTDRQRLANRANARASAGPKTSGGKLRSARNALRHGLNIPIWGDPVLAPQAEAIARKIAGPNADPEALERARRIGEAQIDLNRVRAWRTILLTNLLANVNYRPRSFDKDMMRLLLLMLSSRQYLLPSHEKAIQRVTNHRRLAGDEKLATILEDRSPKLARLDRYERRALSRRKFAMRMFDAGRLREVLMSSSFLRAALSLPRRKIVARRNQLTLCWTVNRLSQLN